MNSNITTLPKNLDTYSVSSIGECDKSTENIYIVNGKPMEQKMSDTNYKQVKAECKGYEVIFEFPENSDNETSTHKEVKQILSNLLQEQIADIS